MIPGCPRHRHQFSRACVDVRCQRNWVPAGAPTPDEQLARWVSGESICPNTQHECCPDFSCCQPKLAWPMDRRAKFVAADQSTREKMMMGALGSLAAQTVAKLYVTRGDPADRG
jgi:hypothetical protein